MVRLAVELCRFYLLYDIITASLLFFKGPTWRETRVTHTPRHTHMDTHMDTHLDTHMDTHTWTHTWTHLDTHMDTLS